MTGKWTGDQEGLSQVPPGKTRTGGASFGSDIIQRYAH